MWDEWGSINIRTLSGVGQRAGERSCAAQGAQAGTALAWGGAGGGEREEGCV